MTESLSRPKAVLIIGSIGWLFAPLLLYILWFKADSLMAGTSNYPAWFVIADGIRMACYVASIAGFWWMRRWSIDLYVAATLVMTGLYLSLGIFNFRELALPLLICIVGLAYRRHLRV